MDGNPLQFQLEYAGKHTDQFVWDNNTEVELSYCFNKQGFRSNIEFIDVTHPCVVYLGDSTTFGMGVEYEQTWAFQHHKAHHPELEYINLGAAGGSIETTHRLLTYWSDHLDIKHAYILHPNINRQEFISSNEIESIGFWNTKMAMDMGGFWQNTEQNRFKQKLFLDLVSQERHQYWLQKRCEHALGYLKTIIDLKCSFPIPTDFNKGSRDGFHAGPNEHREILNWFEDESNIMV